MCSQLAQQKPADVLQKPQNRLSAVEVLSHPFLINAPPGHLLQLSHALGYHSRTTSEYWNTRSKPSSSMCQSSTKSFDATAKTSTTTPRTSMTDKINLSLSKRPVTGYKPSAVSSGLRTVQQSSSTLSSRASSPLARAQDKDQECVAVECDSLLRAKVDRKLLFNRYARRRPAVNTMWSDASLTTPDLSPCDSEDSSQSEHLASPAETSPAFPITRQLPVLASVSRPGTTAGSPDHRQYQPSVSDTEPPCTTHLVASPLGFPKIEVPHLAPPSQDWELARPVRLTTTYLTPQTQKLIKGQLIVLPSRSLLVDFREGERRKHRKGDEVLVVSEDGLQVRSSHDISLREVTSSV